MGYKKILIFILICFIISDTLFYIALSGFGDAYFTPILLFTKYISLFLLINVARRTKWALGLPNSIYLSFKLFLGWNIVTIIHGAFKSSGYWDWKFLLLSSSLFMLIPLAFLVGKNLGYIRVVFYYTLRYLFLYGFLLLPLTFATNEELYSRIMIPVTFFIIFVPYLTKKQQILVLGVAALSFLMILDFRTNILKISLAILLFGTFYLRRIISVFWFKFLQIVIFALPIILLTLAITSQYNLFEDLAKNEGYSVKTKTFEESNLAADTRTFLYVEVFNAVKENSDWLIGKGATGKYRSDYFTEGITGNMRAGSEVGFLNTLLYSGVVGVILYGIMLFLSSYYAIYKSNNWLSKMLGILIATRWLLFFLEEFTQFDLNFFFLWIIIGLVCTSKFRSMNDREIKSFLTFKRNN
ncbi:hypothetical protein [Pedobacter sp. MC2016-24]|uniref:hypothetical protein n=1 Tax=Pedobacter sp. MC2016-24 TaxID=2780090 RepID=UPI00187E97C9|nr:hypothetical protein [Pedobacter sp. MC2016-24]MBE9599523.1 hypothetical protein [Pedobacter sp. MC2016-24]